MLTLIYSLPDADSVERRGEERQAALLMDPFPYFGKRVLLFKEDI